MKKFITLLLCAVMMLALLSGCTAPAKTGTDDTTKAADTTSAEPTYKVLNEDFGDEEYAIAFRKEDSALCAKVQETLDKIYADGTGATIATKWFGSDVILKDNDYPSPLSTIEGEDNSLKYIMDKGTLVLGLDDQYPPMGYVDDKSGEIVGFDVDLAKELCSRLNVELVLQPIAWEAKESELTSKNIDVIWSGLSVTDDRIAAFNLSKPYLANAQIVLVMSDSGISSISDLAGKIVGTQASSAGLDAINASEIKDTLGEVVESADYLTAIADLKTGRLDAVVGDKTLIEYILSNQE